MTESNENILFQNKEYIRLEELLAEMAGNEKRDGCEAVCEFLKEQFNRENDFYQKKYVLPMAEKILQGDDSFDFDGQTFAGPGQLADYLQDIADHSPAKLKAKGSRLLMDRYHLEPVFAGWLIRMGQIEAVKEWISLYREMGDGFLSRS